MLLEELIVGKLISGDFSSKFEQDVYEHTRKILKSYVWVILDLRYILNNIDFEQVHFQGERPLIIEDFKNKLAPALEKMVEYENDYGDLLDMLINVFEIKDLIGFFGHTNEHMMEYRTRVEMFLKTHPEIDKYIIKHECDWYKNYTEDLEDEATLKKELTIGGEE